MAPARGEDLPFSQRYSLPSQLAGSLGDVSWDTVVQLSTDFQASVPEKRGKAAKLVKELQMTRILLMDRIRHASERGGGVDPKILVDVVKLLHRCEEVAEQYDLDLRSFSTFVYMISEKLKKEKLAKHPGELELSRLAPIKEELERLKDRSELMLEKKKRKKKKR
ncbi:MAG: hypothetical protein QW568_02975 [Candidatus Anstonellaceae archaeon]